MVEGLLGVLKGEEEVRMRFDSDVSAINFALHFCGDLNRRYGFVAFPIGKLGYVAGSDGGEEFHLTIPSGNYHAVEKFLSRQMRPDVA